MEFASLVDCLRTMLLGSTLGDEVGDGMSRRLDRGPDDTLLQEVLDEKHYKNLVNKTFTWKGRTATPTGKSFSRDTHVVLGFNAHGIAP